MRKDTTPVPKQPSPGLNGPTDDVYDRIVAAVFEHRLAPGTKLGEDRLASIFNVSRGRVRLALARLAHEHIVRLEPNRGAYVASPSPAEARLIFEARRTIEPGIVRQLAESVKATDLSRLRLIVRAEADARARNDRSTVIRMSGEFHMTLAELAANPFLVGPMRELVSLTCLIIFLYDAPHIPSCHGDEHAAIVTAIAERNPSKAVKLMAEHLDHVERSLALASTRPANDDLEAVFA